MLLQIKDEQQSTKSNKQMAQLQDEIVDAIVVFIVRVTLLVGFVVGAILYGQLLIEL